jgi:flagellar basal body rod protein FlgF
VLDGLFIAPAVAAITEALETARATTGPIAVVGNARLAAALATSREVVPVALSARAARKFAHAVATVGELAAGSLAAVIGVDVAIDGDGHATVAGWARAVRDGGVIVCVDRGHAAEASRRALCGGLCEIEQRHAGRAVVTSGLVSAL